MDLDNYNRNTREGLHTTSIAAAWMNIVYGFGGMRSDGDRLVFQPSIPQQWQSYSFRILYQGAVLCVAVGRESVSFQVVSGPAVLAQIYGTVYDIDYNGIELAIPAEYRAS